MLRVCVLMVLTETTSSAAISAFERSDASRRRTFCSWRLNGLRGGSLWDATGEKKSCARCSACHRESSLETSFIPVLPFHLDCTSDSKATSEGPSSRNTRTYPSG